jgi:hypothetical protein
MFNNYYKNQNNFDYIYDTLEYEYKNIKGWIIKNRRGKILF